MEKQLPTTLEVIGKTINILSKHLIVQINKHAVKVLFLENEQLLKEEQKRLSENNELKLKGELDLFFENLSSFHFIPDHISVSYDSCQSTLVPSNVFTESKPKEIFDLCFGNTTLGKDIDYNRISDQLIVNVFDLPYWIKSFFVVKYPMAIIQHESTYILRKINSEPSFKQKMVVQVYPAYFQVYIIEKSQLQFFNSIEYNHIDDIIYHLSFILQQKEIDGNEIIVHLSHGLEVDSALLTEISSTYSKVFTKNKQIEINPQFIIQTHQLCVS